MRFRNDGTDSYLPKLACLHEAAPIQSSPVFNPELMRKGFEEWFEDMFGRNGKFRPSDCRQAGHQRAHSMREGAERLFKHLYEMSYEPIKVEMSINYGKSGLELWKEIVQHHHPDNEVRVVGKPCKVQINVTIPKTIKQ